MQRALREAGLDAAEKAESVAAEHAKALREAERRAVAASAEAKRLCDELEDSHRQLEESEDAVFDLQSATEKLKRAGSPSSLAAPICFVASNASSDAAEVASTPRPRRGSAL